MRCLKGNLGLVKSPSPAGYLNPSRKTPDIRTRASKAKLWARCVCLLP